MKTNLLTTLFGRMPSRREREHAYLSASVSIYDLERRERDVAKGMFRQG